MPKVGDRVVVEGSKVGGGRREGTLRKVVGSMIQVQWEDGSETLFAPGAGTVQFLPAAGKSNGKAGKPEAKKAPAAKKPSKDASKGASKAPARAGAKSLAKKTTTKAPAKAAAKAPAKKAGKKK